MVFKVLGIFIMVKWLLLSLGLLSSTVYAGIVISGTRFIYPSNDKSIAVKLNNPDGTPVLAQSWLEQPDEKVVNKVPFVITPPLTRIEPNSTQSLRIRYTGEPLPQDRESLFYLNILDIPAKPKDLGKDENYLQFTFRNRLKFFFRPTKLPYTVDKAYDKVLWSLSGSELKINNPTPYYITYAGLEFKQDEKSVYTTSDIDMVAPFENQTITLKESPKANQIQWYVINDYGGTQSGLAKLN